MGEIERTMRNYAISFSIILVLTVLALGGWYYMSGREMSVNNFSDCVAAGYPVMESHPRQCRAGDRNFVEEIQNPDQNNGYMSYKDMIGVYHLSSGQKISSPVILSGQARGNWYFEASFPVKVMDGNGKELGVGIAQAQGEWMTTDYVPFSVTLIFSAPETPAGTVEFIKDNPSGLPENDDKFVVPVTF
jgi:hypothetical protein